MKPSGHFVVPLEGSQSLITPITGNTLVRRCSRLQNDWESPGPLGTFNGFGDSHVLPSDDNSIAVSACF